MMFPIQTGLPRFNQLRQQIAFNPNQQSDMQQYIPTQPQGISDLIQQYNYPQQTFSQYMTRMNNAYSQNTLPTPQQKPIQEQVPIPTNQIASKPSQPIDSNNYQYNIKSPTFAQALYKTEGGGNPDRLFGNFNEAFPNTQISQMPIKDVLAFATGPYANYSKNKLGYTATPMGIGQIVGSTLKNKVKQLNIDPNTPFSPEVQGHIINSLFTDAVGNNTLPVAIKNLRNTWTGLKNIPNNQIAQMIFEYRRQNNGK